jgi:hypothetical protein
VGIRGNKDSAVEMTKRVLINQLKLIIRGNVFNFEIFGIPSYSKPRSENTVGVEIRHSSSQKKHWRI